MRRRLKCFVIFGLGICLAGCGDKAGNEETQAMDLLSEQGEEEQAEKSDIMETQSEGQKEIVTVKSQHYEGVSDENNKLVKYTYQYDTPVISIQGNQNAQNLIQSDLEEYVDDFLDSLSNGNFGIVYEDETTETSYQNLSMSVIRADDKVISIMMTTEGYDGGAHGWNTVAYFNYFTNTGEKITFDKLGPEFRTKAEALVGIKAREMQKTEDIFFEDYQTSIPLVVIDGTEDSKEVYSKIYGDEWSGESGQMIPTFYVNDTGFGFTSGQYVLQPYAAGIIDFTFTAADFGESCTADIFDAGGAEVKTITETAQVAQQGGETGPVTEEQYNRFTKTAQVTPSGKFDDFAQTLAADFTGTWYDPEMGEAIRLTNEGAYVYIPYLDLYGDTLCEWEVLDRSERGLCPELAIYAWGRTSQPLAYYIAGCRDSYFWCNAQDQIFYRQ